MSIDKRRVDLAARRTRHSVTWVPLALFLILGVLSLLPLAAQESAFAATAPPFRLFQTGSVASADSAGRMAHMAEALEQGPQQGGRVVRNNWMTVDAAAMRGLFRQALPALYPQTASTNLGASVRRQPLLAPVILDLFPDTVISFFPERVVDRGALPGSVSGLRSRETGRTLRGRLLGNKPGTVILSEFEGALSGSIQLENGEIYELTAQPGGPVEVRQLEDLGRFPENDTLLPEFDEDATVDVATTPGSIGEAFVAASPSLVDEAIASYPQTARYASGERVLTVSAFYTPRVLQGLGSSASFHAYLRRLEEESNLVLANSRLDMEFRFVAAYAVDFDDTKVDMSYATAVSELRRIYEPATGVRSRLSTLLVGHPLPTSGRITVGMAYLRVTFSPAQRHSVVHYRYAGSPSLSFAHEAGHNFGCSHDAANGGENGGLFSYSRGYQHTAGTPRFYTVMAYSCSGCAAIPYFSDPNILYQGVPVGTADTRCSATLESEARDASWNNFPPATGCVVDLQPSSLILGPNEQDFHLYVHTGLWCEWSLSAGDAQSEGWFQNQSGSNSMTGPAWLRLRIAANRSPEARNILLSVRGLPYTITQQGSGSASLTVTPSRLSVHASSQQDSDQEHCVYVESSLGNVKMRVQADSLPSWLTMDRNEGDLPGFLCARIKSSAMAQGNYQAAVNLKVDSPAAHHLQLPIALQVDAGIPAVRLSPRALAFRATPQQPVTAAQTLEITGPSGMELLPPSWLLTSLTETPEGALVSLHVDASGMAVGVYDARVLLQCRHDTCGQRVIPVRLEVSADTTGAGPRISSGGVVQAASFRPGLSAGAWMSLFGENLSAASRGWTGAEIQDNRLPTSLDGVRVSVDGAAAAISYISPGQVNFQCPALSRSGWVTVEIENAAGRHQIQAYAETRNPGLFLFRPTGEVAAHHLDATPAAESGLFGEVPSRAAKSGDLLSLYGTGFGPTVPVVPPGLYFEGAAPLDPAARVNLSIGGVTSQILFIGQSGAGLNQINLRVPDLPPGDHPVRLRIGTELSAWTATLRVE